MKKDLKTLKKTLEAHEEIKFAYVFGSRARGREDRAGKLSDMDIAVFVDDTAMKDNAGASPYGYRAQLTSELIKALKTNRVDVVILNEARPFLRFQVIRDGILITSKDDKERVRFWVDTMRRYDDAKRLMAIQHHYMKKRIQAGEFGK